jgi:tetratricopeptide (TPR) repeat protein
MSRAAKRGHCRSSPRPRNSNPTTTPSALDLALAFLATGAIKEAREEALHLLGRPSSDEQVPMLLVATSTTTKELDDAKLRLRALPAASASSAPVQVAFGQLALRENQPAEAEKFFRAALAADEKSAAAHSALGLLHWSRRELPLADAALKRAAELSGPRSSKRLQYAQFKLQTGELAAGRSLLEEVSRQTPDFLPVWVWLAELAAADKKFDEAENLLGKALARDPLHPEALLLAARVRLAKGETDKAISELDRLSSLFPKSGSINYHLGLAYAAKNDTAKALSRLTLAASSPEMATPATIAIGEIHVRKRDFSAAVAALLPLAKQQPGLTAAHLLLAEAYRGRGELDQADALYTQLEKDQPRDAQLAYAHGVLLAQKGRVADAKVAFNRARDLFPGHFGALEQLVNLEVAAKNYAAARRLVEADLAQAAQPAPHTLLLARVCLAQGDNPAAEAALLRAIELQPDSPNAHFMLARLYLSSQQPEKALANLRGTLEKNPRNLPALLLLGVIQHERKDYAGARDAYEKALAVEPKSTLALNNLAYLYSEHLAQLDKAYEMAQRARALTPLEPRTADTLGWIMVKRKTYSAAVVLLQESAARLPEEPEVHYHLGVARYLLGEESHARAALLSALHLKTTFNGADDARERLAILDIVPGQADSAARERLEKQIAQHDDDTVALFRSAEILRLAGDQDKALARYQAVLQANPKHVGALVGGARVYAAKQDFAKALELARTARGVAPDQVEISHTVGRLAYETGDYRWSASVLDDAVRQRPTDADILFDWASSVYSLGRVDDAQAGLRRALQAPGSFTRKAAAERFLALVASAESPRRAAADLAAAQQALASDAASVPALLIVALAAEQKADPASARKYYERILARFPDFSPAQRNLALLYAATPADDAKALALATKARPAFPNDPALARAIGMAAYRQGDYTKAASLLQETAKGGSKDGDLLYYLGMAQGRLNKKSESKLSLQRALELGLSESLAAEARKSLAGLN